MINCYFVSLLPSPSQKSSRAMKEKSSSLRTIFFFSLFFHSPRTNQRKPDVEESLLFHPLPGCFYFMNSSHKRSTKFQTRDKKNAFFTKEVFSHDRSCSNTFLFRLSLSLSLSSSLPFSLLSPHY